jgi:hypothetical protein
MSIIIKRSSHRNRKFKKRKIGVTPINLKSKKWKFSIKIGTRYR